ncbi:MAG: DUF58 domain-containing protein [Deltaproteobacteria bacterium]
MRPSNRLIALVLIAAAITVICTLALPEPGVAVFGLWTLLALVLVGDAFLSIPPRGMSAQVSLPKSGMVGVDAPFQLALTRARGAMPDRMALRFDLDAPLGDGVLPDVTGEAAAAIKGRLPMLKRGLHQLRALHLKWASRFGLLEIMTSIKLNHDVIVAPDIGPVTSGQIQTQMLPLLEGQKDMRIKGTGSEFHQLRDFAPGMDPRQIDWKRSARLRALVARETRAEKNHQILLAIDCGYLMSERIAGLPKLDRAINAALAMGWAAGLGGDHVGLYSFDSRPRQFLPPLPGRAGFPRLQAAAAALTYADQETNHTLGLSHLLTRLKRRSLIIVFSDFVDSITAELLVENVTLLNRHHLVLFVALRDPALAKIAMPDDVGLDAIAASVSASQILSERHSVMERLSRLGVLCLDVSPDMLTSALVSKYIEIKAREMI